jgi:hypothetical protein
MGRPALSVVATSRGSFQRHQEEHMSTIQAPAGPRKRLSEVKTVRDLLPFVRASSIEDVSLYWLPVSEFPIGFRQRAWILEFLDQLNQELKKDKQTTETFLQLKFARTELNGRFTNTLMEYRPMTGLMLAPGGALPHNLTPLSQAAFRESRKGRHDRHRLSCARLHRLVCRPTAQRAAPRFLWRWGNDASLDR